MKAVHKHTGNHVAIKVAFKENERTMPSQIPDIRLLEKLRETGGNSQKHILKYIYYFDDESYFYIVTQWMKLNDV